MSAHAFLTVEHCPSCGRASRLTWRCEWCGKLFDDGDGGVAGR